MSPQSSSSSNKRSHCWRALFRRKVLHFEDATSSASSSSSSSTTTLLRRSLTAWDLILYGVGSSVGAGIYVLVGIGAHLAGPAISVSFLMCGAACILTSFCYAEFAARIPVTGSAFVYSYVSFGEFVAWLVGWNLTLGYAFTTSVVARAWADYFGSFLRNAVASTESSSSSPPTWLLTTITYLTEFPLLGEAVDYRCSPLSVVLITGGTLVLLRGAKDSARFNNAMTILNLSVLLAVILAGIGTNTIEMDNLTPFAPHGVSGIVQGAGLVFFAFIGFDMVASLSEEVIRPERNVPLGIIGSLVISIALYVSVSLVVVGMAPIALLGKNVPIVNALLANACCTHEEQLQTDAAILQCLSTACVDPIRPFLAVTSNIVSLGAILGLIASCFTSLMGQPRIFLGLARDGLIPPLFAQVDPETQVPRAGIIVTGIATALLACFVSLDALASLISLGTLMVFTFVDVGLLLLRVSELPTNASLSRPHHVGTTSSTTLLHTGNDIHNKSDKEYKNSLEIRASRVFVLTPLFCIFTLASAMLHVHYSSSSSSSSDSKNDHHLGSGGLVARFGLVFCLLGAIGTVVAILWLLPMSLMSSSSSSPKRRGGETAATTTTMSTDTFQCPAMPLIPLAGSAANIVMMASLPLSSWLFLLVWMSAGIAFYFLYSMHHSLLGKEQEREDYALHGGNSADSGGTTTADTIPLLPLQHEGREAGARSSVKNYQSTSERGLVHHRETGARF